MGAGMMFRAVVFVFACIVTTSAATYLNTTSGPTPVLARSISDTDTYVTWIESSIGVPFTVYQIEPSSPWFSPPIRLRLSRYVDWNVRNLDLTDTPRVKTDRVRHKSSTAGEKSQVEY